MILSLLCSNLWGGQIQLGLGFDRNHDGHGYELYKVGETYQLFFYTYDSDGNPEWYLGVAEMNGGWLQGNLTRFTYDPKRSPPQTPDPERSGKFWLDFTEDGALQACGEERIKHRPGGVQFARFWWHLAGKKETWCTEFLEFVPDAHLADRGNSGVWYNGESDTGYGFTYGQQNQVSSLVAYFYDDTGEPVWALGVADFDPTLISFEMKQYKGYCRTCKPVPRLTGSSGQVVIDWSQPSVILNLQYDDSKFERVMGSDTLTTLSDLVARTEVEMMPGNDDRYAQLFSDVFGVWEQKSLNVADGCACPVAGDIDLDNDGDLDVIQTFRGNEDHVKKLTELQEAVIHRNLGKEGFSTEPTQIKTYGSDRFIGDLNNDGLEDIYHGFFGYDFDPFPGSPNYLLFQDDSGGLSDVTSTNIEMDRTLFDHGATHSTCAGDFDGDGDLDIYHANSYGGSGYNVNARFLINNGSGKFVDQTDQSLPKEILFTSNDDLSFPEVSPDRPSGRAFPYITWCEFADVNNDGLADLILGSANGDERGHYTRSGINVSNSHLVLLSDGQTFEFRNPGGIVKLSSGVVDYIETNQSGDDFGYPATLGLTFADFNQDGCMDLAAAMTDYQETHVIEIFHNDENCSGAFTATNWFSFPFDFGEIAIDARDVNGDGLIDIVYTINDWSRQSRVPPGSDNDLTLLGVIWNKAAFDFELEPIREKTFTQFGPTRYIGSYNWSWPSPQKN